MGIKGFSHKHNSDNIHRRAIIIGLINLLNNKLQYPNILSDTEIDIISIPWFPSASIDERFIQDYFTFWNDCAHPNVVDGNYDSIPRGTAVYTNTSIDTSQLTNKFVRMEYVKEIDGMLETFSAYTNSIPIVMSFDCEILVPSFTDALKIEQVIIETFYKSQTFNVWYKGFKLPSHVGFPEDFTGQETTEFEYGEDNRITIEFSLEVETFQPIIDKTSEIHTSQRIEYFGKTYINEKLNKQITINKPETNIEVNSNSLLNIKWNTIGTILDVIIEYKIKDTDKWINIENGIINYGEYDWIVPEFNKDRPIVVIDGGGEYIKTNLQPIVDYNGSIEKVIIKRTNNLPLNDFSNPDLGIGYDNNTIISIEQTTINGINNSAKAEIITQEGRVIDVKILDGGSGYIQTKPTEISIRIKSVKNNEIYDQLDKIIIK